MATVLGQQPSDKVQRRHDLDWVGVITILLVFQYHVGIIFTGGWQIENDQHIRGMGQILFVGSFWRMPLLFFVAGIGTWLALRRRSGTYFTAERSRLRLLPLVFGTLLITPPQYYFSDLSRGESPIAYPGFHLDYVQTALPVIDYHWGHLWFIGYLFVYSTLALPVFLFIRGTFGRAIVERVVALLCRNLFILLLVVPLAVVEIGLRWRWPGDVHLIND